MNPASEQFYERFKAFQRANPGMVHVVRGNADPEIVREWLTYFHVRGQTGTIDLFRQLLTGNGAVQFPCRRPVDFDPSYVPPVHEWREPYSKPDSRSDMRHIIDRTLESLRKAVPRGRQPVPKDHLKAPEKTPQEWLADYQANPPPIPVLSDEARAKFRLPYRDEESAA